MVHVDSGLILLIITLTYLTLICSYFSGTMGRTVYAPSWVVDGYGKLVKVNIPVPWILWDTVCIYIQSWLNYQPQLSARFNRHEINMSCTNTISVPFSHAKTWLFWNSETKRKKLNLRFFYHQKLKVEVYSFRFSPNSVVTLGVLTVMVKGRGG